MELITGPAQAAPNGEDLPTVCVLCSHNCGLRVDVANNEIVKIRADERNPITHGYSCNKGYSIGHYVRHAQRTEHPLKRRPDGTFERISWNQAITEIAAKLNEILKKHPPRAVAIAGVGGQGNHLDGFYAGPFFMGLGSPMIFNALAQEKTQHALVDKWIFGAPSNCYFHADAEHSNYVLMIGTNPVLSNRGHNATELIKALRAAENRELVVVDPKRTETARRAHKHLALKPGTDVYLLLGLAAYIVREDLADREFLRAKAVGSEQLFEILSRINPADMARRAGIDPSDLAEVARGYASADSACIFNDLGAEQIPYSTLVAYLIRVLALLTGNLGTPGGNVFLGMFNPNVPEPRVPAKALVSEIEAISMFAPTGMFSPNLIPEEILTHHPDRIRALIVEGANPLVSYADSHKLREALGKLELLVVVDPAFTETARLADYVLPTPVGYEKWEYSTFPKGYPEISAQLRPPVVRGPEDALPESEIYFRLAHAMGMVEKAPRLLHRMARFARKPWGAAAYFAALVGAALVKGRSAQGAVPRVAFWAYETLGPRLPSPAVAMMWFLAHGFALTRKKDVARIYPEVKRMRNPFAVGEFLFKKILDNPGGVHVAALDPARNFEDHTHHADEKARIVPAAMPGEIARALADSFHTDSDYPFILNGGMRTNWNANTIQRDPSWRKGKGPHCPVVLHPDDAKAVGVASGDPVVVETRRGSAQAPALVDESAQPGHIHIPNGFGLEYPDPETGALRRVGVRINELTDAADRDPFTGCPHHKHIRCRVRAATRDAA